MGAVTGNVLNEAGNCPCTNLDMDDPSSLVTCENYPMKVSKVDLLGGCKKIEVSFTVSRSADYTNVITFEKESGYGVNEIIFGPNPSSISTSQVKAEISLGSSYVLKSVTVNGASGGTLRLKYGQLQLEDIPGSDSWDDLVVSPNEGFFIGTNRYTLSAVEDSFVNSATLQIQRNQFLGAVSPSNEFVISFTLHPLGKIANWGSILRFTTNSNNMGSHGDRSPGIWFCPNSLQIHFTYYDKSNGQKSADFGQFNPSVDYNIEIKAIGNYIIWYTNGKPEMTLYVPLSDRSFTSPLLIYAGDDHYDPANAKISHVVYKPNPTIPSEVSFLENEKLQIQRNHYLGAVNPSSEYVISFTLHPLGSIANWGSILIFSTNINSAYGNHGDRNPGIWFCPNSLTIAFRYFLKNNAQRSFNFGSLSPNVDYNIEIKAIGDYIIWYTNDKIEFMLHIPLSDRSFDSPLLIYAGNKYEDPANAKISNVAYKLNPTIPTIPSELSLLENEKLQIQRNYFLGVVKSSSEYVISFTLHPLGTITSWGSILRFSTDSERESNKHGDRSPGIYFCPNSLTIAF